MASSSTQHEVDIDELSASIEKKLHMLPPSSGVRSIYCVLHEMRSSCEQYFTPQILSIGPMHYQNEKLRANEHLKDKYLAEFLELTKASVKECSQLVLQHERRLRSCYANVIKLNSENFVKLVLVDAVFLLMTILYNNCKILVSDTDMLYKNPEMIRGIRYDLLLLENQLPFFILDDLYKLSKLQSILESMFDLDFSEEIAVTFLTINFFRNLLTPKVLEQHPPSYPAHILDLYRSCLIPAYWNPERYVTKTMNMPSMKKLYQAGLKIQVGSKENMFDIRFNDGILKIPPSFINDSTELLYRNILAYELCHFSKMFFFSHYLEMMRLLTRSSEDTELLVQNGVIINGLQNNEKVSKLFQDISAGNIINYSEFLYTDIIESLLIYFSNCWNRWRAILKEKYFSVAVLILVLTIIQTIFTVLQVVLPK